MSLFYPTLYRRRITDVTIEDLRRQGVRGVLLDVDNTLTIHDAPDVTPEVATWLQEMTDAGFVLAIVSNNHPDRVAPFAEKLGLPFYALSRKPLPKGFRAAAADLGLRRNECVAIGDQIFTDIMGANLAGMTSILLEPIQPEVDQKFIVFKRKIEKPLLNTPLQRRRKESHYANG